MGQKRQVVADYDAGETLHGLCKRHDVCRNLIRVWIAKAEAGAFDDEVAATGSLVRLHSSLGYFRPVQYKLSHARQPLKIAG